MANQEAGTMQVSGQPASGLTSGDVLAIDMQRRRTKGYPLTNSEMLGLSIINPVTGMLIGWGLQMWIAWADMEPTKDRTITGLGVLALLGGGILLQMYGWWIMLRAKMECDQHPGGILLWIIERRISAVIAAWRRIRSR